MAIEKKPDSEHGRFIPSWYIQLTTEEAAKTSNPTQQEVSPAPLPEAEEPMQHVNPLMGAFICFVGMLLLFTLLYAAFQVGRFFPVQRQEQL